MESGPPVWDRYLGALLPLVLGLIVGWLIGTRYPEEIYLYAAAGSLAGTAESFNWLLFATSALIGLSATVIACTLVAIMNEITKLRLELGRREQS